MIDTKLSKDIINKTQDGRPQLMRKPLFLQKKRFVSFQLVWWWIHLYLHILRHGLVNLQIKVTKILYYRLLLLDKFHFCGTHFTTFQRFVANTSAISLFLGGLWMLGLCCTNFMGREQCDQEMATHEKSALANDHNCAPMTLNSARGVARTSTRRLGHPARVVFFWRKGLLPTWNNACSRIDFWTTFPKLNSPISFPNGHISRFYFVPNSSNLVGKDFQ